jgi:capsular polysaccharide biosynthesis protein
MTFKEFIKILKEKYWLIIACVIIVFTGTFWFNHKIETTFEGNIGFSIVRFGKTQKSEFADYYATQADNLVTANFAKWLQSKAFIADIYQRTGKSLDGQNLNKLVKKTSVQKVSGTDISMSFETTGKEATLRIGQSIMDAVNVRNTQIKKSADQDNNLRGLAISSRLTIYQQSTNKLFNYLLGLVGGIILGFVLILLVRYFNKSTRS